MKKYNHHNIWKRVIAGGVVCLFLFNIIFEGVSFADPAYSSIATGNIGTNQRPKPSEMDETAQAARVLRDRLFTAVYGFFYSLHRDERPANRLAKEVMVELVDVYLNPDDTDTGKRVKNIIIGTGATMPMTDRWIASAARLGRSRPSGTALASKADATDAAQADKGALVGVHRNLEGVNDQIRGHFADCLTWLNYEGYISIPDGADLDTLKQEIKEKTDEDDIKLPINKSAISGDRRAKAGNGQTLAIVELPVDSLAEVPDGEDGVVTVGGHIGLRNGIVWVAVGTSESRKDEGEIEAKKWHEVAEYNVVTDVEFVKKYITNDELLKRLLTSDGKAVNVEAMADWRDGKYEEFDFEETVRFFQRAHRQAWARVAATFDNEITELEQDLRFTSGEERRLLRRDIMSAERKLGYARQAHSSSEISASIEIDGEMQRDIAQTSAKKKTASKKKSAVKKKPGKRAVAKKAAPTKRKAAAKKKPSKKKATKKKPAKVAGISKEALRARELEEIARDDNGFVIARELPKGDALEAAETIHLFKPDGSRMLERDVSKGYGFDDGFLVTFGKGENAEAWKLRDDGSIGKLDCSKVTRVPGTRFIHVPGYVALHSPYINDPQTRANGKGSRDLVIFDLAANTRLLEVRPSNTDWDEVFEFGMNPTHFAIGYADGARLYPLKAETRDEDTNLPDPVNVEPIPCDRLALTASRLITREDGMLTVRDLKGKIIEEKIDGTNGFEVKGNLLIAKDRDNRLAVLDLRRKGDKMVIVRDIDDANGHDIEGNLLIAKNKRNMITVVDLNRRQADKMVLVRPEDRVDVTEGCIVEGHFLAARGYVNSATLLDLRKKPAEMKIVPVVDAEKGFTLRRGHFVAMGELGTCAIWDARKNRIVKEKIAGKRTAEQLLSAYFESLAPAPEDLTQANIASLVGVHRGIDGVNEQIDQHLLDQITWLFLEGRLSEAEAEAFLENEGEGELHFINEGEGQTVTADNGTELTIIELPVDTLALIQDAKNEKLFHRVAGHVGLRRGIVWVAAGAEGSPKKEAEIELIKRHEIEEYNVVSDPAFVRRHVEDPEGLGLIGPDGKVDMEKMARWRDGEFGVFKERKRFFDLAHKEAWGEASAWFATRFLKLNNELMFAKSSFAGDDELVELRKRAASMKRMVKMADIFSRRAKVTEGEEGEEGDIAQTAVRKKVQKKTTAKAAAGKKKKKAAPKKGTAAAKKKKKTAAKKGAATGKPAKKKRPAKKRIVKKPSEDTIGWEGATYKVLDRNEHGYAVAAKVDGPKNEVCLFKPNGTALREELDITGGLGFDDNYFVTMEESGHLHAWRFKSDGSGIEQAQDIRAHATGRHILYASGVVFVVNQTIREKAESGFRKTRDDTWVTGLEALNLDTGKYIVRHRPYDLKEFADVAISATHCVIGSRAGGKNRAVLYKLGEDLERINQEPIPYDELIFTGEHVVLRDENGVVTLRDLDMKEVPIGAEPLNAAKELNVDGNLLIAHGSDGKLAVAYLDRKPGNMVVVRDIDATKGYRRAGSNLAACNKHKKVSLINIKPTARRREIVAGLEAAHSFSLTDTHLVTIDDDVICTARTLSTGKTVTQQLDAASRWSVWAFDVAKHLTSGGALADFGKDSPAKGVAQLSLRPLVGKHRGPKNVNEQTLLTLTDCLENNFEFFEEINKQKAKGERLKRGEARSFAKKVRRLQRNQHKYPGKGIDELLEVKDKLPAAKLAAGFTGDFMSIAREITGAEEMAVVLVPADALGYTDEGEAITAHVGLRGGIGTGIMFVAVGKDGKRDEVDIELDILHELEENGLTRARAQAWEWSLDRMADWRDGIIDDPEHGDYRQAQTFFFEVHRDSWRNVAQAYRSRIEELTPKHAQLEDEQLKRAIERCRRMAERAEALAAAAEEIPEPVVIPAGQRRDVAQTSIRRADTSSAGKVARRERTSNEAKTHGKIVHGMLRADVKRAIRREGVFHVTDTEVGSMIPTLTADLYAGESDQVLIKKLIDKFGLSFDAALDTVRAARRRKEEMDTGLSWRQQLEAELLAGSLEWHLRLNFTDLHIDGPVREQIMRTAEGAVIMLLNGETEEDVIAFIRENAGLPDRSSRGAVEVTRAELARIAPEVSGKGDIAVSSAGALVGWHKGKGGANEMVLLCLAECLHKELTGQADLYFTDPARPNPLSRKEAEAFIEAVLAAREKAKETDRGVDEILEESGSYKLPIEKLESQARDIHGRPFRAVLLPVEELGKITVDGRQVSVTAHLGIRGGTAWIASGTRRVNADFAHEMSEFMIFTDADKVQSILEEVADALPNADIDGIAARLIPGGNVDMDAMADWRDEASAEAQVFFHIAHREAWITIRRIYTQKINSLTEKFSRAKARLQDDRLDRVVRLAIMGVMDELKVKMDELRVVMGQAYAGELRAEVPAAIASDGRGIAITSSGESQTSLEASADTLRLCIEVGLRSKLSREGGTYDEATRLRVIEVAGEATRQLAAGVQVEDAASFVSQGTGVEEDWITSFVRGVRHRLEVKGLMLAQAQIVAPTPVPELAGLTAQVTSGETVQEAGAIHTAGLESDNPLDAHARLLGEVFTMRLEHLAGKQQGFVFDAQKRAAVTEIAGYAVRQLAAGIPEVEVVSFACERIGVSRGAIGSFIGAVRRRLERNGLIAKGMDVVAPTSMSVATEQEIGAYSIDTGTLPDAGTSTLPMLGSEQPFDSMARSQIDLLVEAIDMYLKARHATIGRPQLTEIASGAVVQLSQGVDVGTVVAHIRERITIEERYITVFVAGAKKRLDRTKLIAVETTIATPQREGQPEELIAAGTLVTEEKSPPPLKRQLQRARLVTGLCRLLEDRGVTGVERSEVRYVVSTLEDKFGRRWSNSRAVETVQKRIGLPSDIAAEFVVDARNAWMESEGAQAAVEQASVEDDQGASAGAEARPLRGLSNDEAARCRILRVAIGMNLRSRGRIPDAEHIAGVAERAIRLLSDGVDLQIINEFVSRQTGMRFKDVRALIGRAATALGKTRPASGRPAETIRASGDKTERTVPGGKYRAADRWKEAKQALVRIGARVRGTDSYGTGAIIEEDKEAIYILTAGHNVERKRKIDIEIEDGGETRVIEGRVMRSTWRAVETRDLALVKVMKSSLKDPGSVPKINISDEYDEYDFDQWQEVRMLSCLKDESGSRTVKPPKKRVFRTSAILEPDSAGEEYLMVRSKIEEGQSGSPLLGIDGTLQGIITGIAVEGGIAITCDKIRQFVRAVQSGEPLPATRRSAKAKGAVATAGKKADKPKDEDLDIVRASSEDAGDEEASPIDKLMARERRDRQFDEDVRRLRRLLGEPLVMRIPPRYRESLLATLAALPPHSVVEEADILKGTYGEIGVPMPVLDEVFAKFAGAAEAEEPQADVISLAGVGAFDEEEPVEVSGADIQLAGQRISTTDEELVALAQAHADLPSDAYYIYPGAAAAEQDSYYAALMDRLEAVCPQSNYPVRVNRFKTVRRSPRLEDGSVSFMIDGREGLNPACFVEAQPDVQEATLVVPQQFVRRLMREPINVVADVLAYHTARLNGEEQDLEPETVAFFNKINAFEKQAPNREVYHGDVAAYTNLNPDRAQQVLGDFLRGKGAWNVDTEAELARLCAAIPGLRGTREEWNYEVKWPAICEYLAGLGCSVLDDEELENIEIVYRDLHNVRGEVGYHFYPVVTIGGHAFLVELGGDLFEPVTVAEPPAGHGLIAGISAFHEAEAQFVWHRHMGVSIIPLEVVEADPDRFSMYTRGIARRPHAIRDYNHVDRVRHLISMKTAEAQELLAEDEIDPRRRIEEFAAAINDGSNLTALKSLHRQFAKTIIEKGKQIIIPREYLEDFADEIRAELAEHPDSDVVIVSLAEARRIAEETPEEEQRNRIVLLKEEDLDRDTRRNSKCRVLELRNCDFLHIAAAMELARAMLADNRVAMEAFFEALMGRPPFLHEYAALIQNRIVPLDLPAIESGLIENMGTRRREYANFLKSA